MEISSKEKIEEVDVAPSWQERNAKFQVLLQETSDEFQMVYSQELEEQKKSYDLRLEELTQNNLIAVNVLEHVCDSKKKELEDIKAMFERHKSDTKNLIERLKRAHVKGMKDEREKHELEKKKLMEEYEEIMLLKKAVDQEREQNEVKLTETFLELDYMVQEKNLILEHEKQMNLLELQKKALEQEFGIEEEQMRNLKAKDGLQQNETEMNGKYSEQEKKLMMEYEKKMSLLELEKKDLEQQTHIQKEQIEGMMVNDDLQQEQAKLSERYSELEYMVQEKELLLEHEKRINSLELERKDLEKEAEVEKERIKHLQRKRNQFSLSKADSHAVANPPAWSAETDD